MKRTIYLVLFIGLLVSGSHDITFAGQEPENTIRSLERAFQSGDAQAALSLFFFATPASREKLVNQFTPKFFATYRTGFRFEVVASQTTNNYAVVLVRPWIQGKPKGDLDISPMFLVKKPEGWLLSPNLENPVDFRSLTGINGEGKVELDALFKWSRKFGQDEDQPEWSRRIRRDQPQTLKKK